MQTTSSFFAPWRRFTGLLLAAALIVASCGGDGDDDDASSDDATTTTAAAETEEAADSGGEAAGLAVELGEWFIGDPGPLTAGSVTFDATNTGEFPHALAIVKGTSYEDLPQKDNGAIDLEAVGDDYLGTTDNLENGQSASITFDLEAGDWVLFCPIEFGPNSHAGNGQVLSVTVG